MTDLDARLHLPVGPYSTLDLQSAAAALIKDHAATLECELQARLQPRPAVGHVMSTGTGTGTPVSGPAGMGRLVRIRAANAGAGASTVALALAEAASLSGLTVRLLDASAPLWSGLSAAALTELGSSQGWRRGRRGSGLVIDRVGDEVVNSGRVPLPRVMDGADLTVLDTGWSARELAAAPATWLTTASAALDLVVTRTSALALGQTELVLHQLERAPAPTPAPAPDAAAARARVLVVVLGTSHQPGRALVAAGPRLRRLHQGGAVAWVPLLSTRALPGLDADALPRQLHSAAGRLLDQITTITGPLPPDRSS